MKRAAWFIVSELLLVLTVVLVFSNWQGTSGFSLAWPVSASKVSINGAEQGGRVLLAFITAILTVLTFFLGLVRLFARDTRPKVAPAMTVVKPPVTPPARPGPGDSAQL